MSPIRTFLKGHSSNPSWPPTSRRSALARRADAAAFFDRTFITEGMALLLTQVKRSTMLI